MLAGEQRDYIRQLGRQVHEFACGPEMERRRQRWRDVNALRRPDRAPVWCRPVGCWAELLPDSDLQTTDPALRPVERDLRQLLIKQDIGDDSICPPHWPVPTVFDIEENTIWGMDIRRIPPVVPGGSWQYDPPIKQESDLENMVLPGFMYNAAATQRRLDFLGELFEGVMPVRRVCKVPIEVNIGHTAANLVGLDNLLLYLALKPNMVHRLMAFLETGIHKVLNDMEASGVLTPNNNGEMWESDPLKPAAPAAPARLDELWTDSNGQEFDKVSPAMWEEFQLTYEKPCLERFGAVAYGGCEDLTRKIRGVLSIRNLRIIVCSPWTDLDTIVQSVGDRRTIMWRQKAGDIVFARDLEPIRQHLRDGMRRSQGCHRTIVCRELQTLNGNLRRLHEWTALAIEAAEAFP